MSELVSCILPTANRPAFARQAIRCFLRQTYDNSELVVVDDGEPSVAELCSGLHRVRYIRLTEPTLLGSKLNIGIEHAKGRIIQKLDDDDYYHPDFLGRAVGALPLNEPEKALVAWDCFLILMAGERHVRHSGHGWAAGGTLCFHRRLWERGPFRSAPRAVDWMFREDNKPRVIKVCEPELYILVRHGRNTWNTFKGDTVNRYFKRLPAYRKPLEKLVEPLDQFFYFSLPKESER